MTDQRESFMDEHYYLIRGGLEGRERLRVLSRVMRPTTLTFLERAGVSSGMRVLDVGCGSGDVTFDLAAIVGITGSVVGVDVDRTKIELARADAEQQEIANVDFRDADLADGLGDEEYDVVYARFVLTHLADPVSGVATMVAALKPGGRLLVEDIDYRASFCDPEHPSFARYEQIYVASALANGGNPYIATALPLMLADAGLERVQPAVIQPAGTEGEVKLLPPLTLENIRATALRHGMADAVEVDRLVDDLYAIAADSRTYVGNPRMVQAWGTKP